MPTKDCPAAKATAWKISTSNTTTWVNNTVTVNRICRRILLFNRICTSNIINRPWTSTWRWAVCNKTWSQGHIRGCQELSKEMMREKTLTENLTLNIFSACIHRKMKTHFRYRLETAQDLCPTWHWCIINSHHCLHLLIWNMINLSQLPAARLIRWGKFGKVFFFTVKFFLWKRSFWKLQKFYWKSMQNILTEHSLLNANDVVI